MALTLGSRRNISPSNGILVNDTLLVEDRIHLAGRPFTALDNSLLQGSFSLLQLSHIQVTSKPRRRTMATGTQDVLWNDFPGIFARNLKGISVYFGVSLFHPPDMTLLTLYYKRKVNTCIVYDHSPETYIPCY